jgi:peptide/nickel transport system substrate-binding protein
MKRLLLLAIAAIAALIIACGGDEAAAPAAEPAAAAPEAAAAPTATPVPEDTSIAPAGEVVVAFGDFSAEILDPATGHNAHLGYYGPMYDFHIGVNSDGSQSTDTGALVGWDMSPDAQSWTLTLRDGMHWHDGTAVTSADGVFTMKRYADPEAVCVMCGLLVTNLDQAHTKTVDGLTYEVHFIDPYQFFDTALTPWQGDIPLLPKHHHEAVGEAGFNGGDPMGSGPYKFASRKIGENIIFEANADYWNEARVPAFQTLRYVLSPEETSRLALVQRGDADLANISGEQIEELERLNLRLMGAKETWIMYGSFIESYDTENNLLSNVDFRKAINLAIDRVAANYATYPGGSAIPVDYLIWKNQDGYNGDLEPYPYDPDEARRIIAANGWEGTEIQMYQYNVATFTQWSLMQEVIAGYLQQVGLKPKLIPIEIGSVIPPIFEGTVDTEDIQPRAWLTTSSLDNNLNVLMIWPGDSAGYHDQAKLDRLYKAYIGALDPAEREAAALAINHAMHDEYAYIPIGLKNELWAAGPKIGEWLPCNGCSFYLSHETLKPAGDPRIGHDPY